MDIVPVTDADGLSRLSFPSSFNASALLTARAGALGKADAPAIYTPEETLTHAQVARLVETFGLALLEMGLAPGDRVVLVLPDSPDFVAMFLGAIRAGIIPIPLNTLLHAEDYAFIFDDSQCAAVVYGDAFADVAQKALSLTPAKPRIACNVKEIAARAAKQAGELSPHPATAADDCFLLYSSGTTGNPKGVVHAHASLPVVCHYFSEHMIGPSQGDIIFSIPRLFTSFGLGIALAVPLWLGASVVLWADRPSSAVVADLIRRFRPTIFAAVPTFYAQLLGSNALDSAGASSLRCCFSGGEAMPPELIRRWQALTGIPIREIIGSTEAGFVYVGTREGEVRPGVTGRPIPGYQIRLLDDAGQPVSDGAPGRLFLRGQAVMKRYWNNPEKTAQTLKDGWLDSGDIYTRDADGYFVCSGRGDDMLKVGGRWVAPFEIESALVAHPKVLEAAVVGRPDADGLIKAEAWIVLNNPNDASEMLGDEIRAFCKERLAPYKYPRRIHFIEQMPKTASGKIQRFKLRNAD